MSGMSETPVSVKRAPDVAGAYHHSPRSVRPAETLPPSCSSASRSSFVSRPPAKPVRSPFAPMTRWQGAMIEIGFFPLGCAHRTRSRRPSDLLCDLGVGPRLAERNIQQCLPNGGLKFGTDEVKGHREDLQRAVEVRFQLPLGLDENVVVRIFTLRFQPHALRIVTFPKYRGQAALA